MAVGTREGRLRFGPNKYAAFHLLLCRWLRHHAGSPKYRYVTLGGTELKDLQSLYFVDPALANDAISFEADGKRYELARNTCDLLNKKGVKVGVRKENIFIGFGRPEERSEDTPHIFYFDFEGVCGFSDYPDQFGRMFQTERIREGDCLLLTSYLDRTDWRRVFTAYDAEFRILGVSSDDDKQRVYKLAHPSFTLYRALGKVNLQGDLSIKCFGCVEYRDTSTMAVYGYAINNGTTTFAELVRDTPAYNLKLGIRS